MTHFLSAAISFRLHSIAQRSRTKAQPQKKGINTLPEDDNLTCHVQGLEMLNGVPQLNKGLDSHPISYL